MRYVVEIWSEIDGRFNPLPTIYANETTATRKMERYLEGAAEDGWATHGRVVPAVIRGKALVPA